MAFKTFGVERSLRTIHAWLGILVLPWVIILGLTGLYLNHTKLVKSFLPSSERASLAVILQWPDPVEVTPDTALELMRVVWPDAVVQTVLEERFRKQAVLSIETDHGVLSVVKRSGHYWLRGQWQRDFYAPDGTLLNHYIAWGGLFKRLHVYGWLTRDFGRWLTDIAAVALVTFGFSGLVLFLNPRLRRRRNKKARLKANGR